MFAVQDEPEFDEIDRAFSVCGYCYRRLRDEDESLMTGGFLESVEGTGPDEYVGRGIELWKGDQYIVALVPEEGAEALEEDQNILFLVCSEPCVAGLDAFLALAAPMEIRELSDETLGRPSF